MGQAGTPGSEVRFNYGAHEFGEFVLGTDFFWASTDTGNDANLSNSDQNVREPGGYCQVPDIAENEDGDSQTITCYFPCNAA